MSRDTNESCGGCFLIAENCDTYLYIVDVSPPGVARVLDDPSSVTECIYKNFDLANRRLIVQDDMAGVWEIIHSAGQFLALRQGHEGIDPPTIRDIVSYQLDLMYDYEIRNLWEYIKLSSFE
jgi:hypothetical protein